MQALFSPAIAVMNRLSYSKKFVVLGCMSMLAVLVVIFSLYQSLNRIIITSQHELDGLVKIRAVTRAIQILQIHRGLSSGLLGGIESLREQLASQKLVADKALMAVQNILPAEVNTPANTLFKNISANWNELRQNGTQLNFDASYTAHTRLIAQLLELKSLLSDASSLSLDTDIDSYHLIMLLTDNLPRVLENIGQLRAFGVGALAQKSVSQEQKVQILVLKASIEQTLMGIDYITEDTSRYNPALRLMLEATKETIHNSAQLINQYVVPDIVQEKFSTDPEYFFSAVTLALNSVYQHIYESFLPATENLIEARIARVEQTLCFSIGIPGVLFTLIIYFAIGAHLSVTHSITALARAAKAFADGELQQRLSIASQDEIGQVAASFNEMADGFNALLKERAKDEIRLQNIINTALDAVVQMDAEGVLRGWNHQAEQIFGWKFAEVKGCRLHEIIIPERFRDSHQTSLKNFLLAGEGTLLNQRIEVTALHRDGHEFPIELAITPNRLQDTIEFSAFIRDISAQKQALQTLQHSEQSFRALFEYSRDALMTLSPTRGFLSGNPAAVSLFGCKNEQEFLQQNPASLSPERQADGNLSSELAQQRITEALSTGSAVFEWLHQRLNGEIFSAEVQLSHIDVDHELVLQATVRDITERKRDRAALIASEARTRAVLRTMSDAVVLIDTYGKMLLVNDALSDMYGYDEDELIDQNVKMLMPEPYFSAHDGYLKRQRETKDRVIIGRRIEVQGRRKDGSLIPIELSVNESMDDMGSTFIGVMRDISNRKAIEQAQAVAVLEAERLAHAKSEFLANMSHEIRTPLNAIIGLANMTIRDNKGRDTQDNCVRIHDAGLHLLSLVNDILDFSKIEAGKMSLDPHPFRLSALIDDTLSLVEMRAQEKHLDLVVERAENLPDWVIGDPLRIRQIIVNLLSNAVKFTERGFVRLSISGQPDEHIQFSVTDSGIGISPEQMSRLFTAFEQADSSTTRKFGGSGLGLAISRNLANLMGGDISAKSAADVGSQFTLCIPLPATEAGIDHQTQICANGPRLQGIRILAAEDVALNRLVLEDMLTYEGAHVILAENGQHALELLEEIGYSEVDIVLMDIQMPIKDGYQTTRQILQTAPDLPVIGLTAHAMPEERQRCLDVGMCERVTKPIDNNILVAAILRYVPAKTVIHNADAVKCLPDIAPETPLLPESAPAPTLETATNSLIDWSAVQQRFDGRQAFIAKLIGNFLDGTYHDNVNKLRRAAEQGDYETIKFIAHSLKGLAGVFESSVLLEQAQQVELAAKNQTANINELGKQLADTLQSLLLELQQYQDESK